MRIKKKTVAGAAAAGVAAVAITGGTFATFSDTEEGPSGSIAAAVVDLVPGENVTNGFSVATIVPGETVGRDFSYQNASNVPTLLDLNFAVTGHENGCNEPEAKVDDTCGTSAGELGKDLFVDVFIDGEHKWDGKLSEFDGAEIEDVVLPNDTVNVNIHVNYQLSSIVDNIAQSDSVEIDTTATLEQKKFAGEDPPA